MKYKLATPNIPGAIAVIDLYGPGVMQVIQDITGGNDLSPFGKLKYCNVYDIDTGLVVCLNNNRAQIMVHGGLRVIQRVREKLASLGCLPVADENVTPQEKYPEASSPDEAMMLSCLSNASSSLAVDLLLQQPHRWAQYRKCPNESLEDIYTRSKILNRLLQPPLIVITGPANVGKSTLTNALVGRSASITHDEPGTTRDYVGIQLDLAGLTAWWFDTPGIRNTDDNIEKSAVDIAKQLLTKADYLILATEPGVDWQIEYNELKKPHVLKIMLKADLLPDYTVSVDIISLGNEITINSEITQPTNLPTADHPTNLFVCAHNDNMLSNLVITLRDTIVPPQIIKHPGPWLFDKRLISDCINSCNVE